MKFSLGSKTSDDLDIALLNTPKPLAGGTNDKMSNVPGQIGGYDYGADLTSLRFRLNCEIKNATSQSELMTKARTIADHLFDDEGNPRTMELSFTDEPDKFWEVRYGFNRRATFMDRIVGGKIGRFTLNLVAADPRAHEAEDTTSQTITSSGGTITVTNSGNVKTPVKIKITNNGSSTINGFSIKREVA